MAANQSFSADTSLFECQTCKETLLGRDMRKHVVKTRHKCILYKGNDEIIQCEDCDNDNVHMLQLVRLGGYDLQCLCKSCLQKANHAADINTVENVAYYDVAQNGQLFQYWNSYIDFSNIQCFKCGCEDSLNISAKPHNSEILCKECLNKFGKKAVDYYSDDSGQFLYKFLNMSEPVKKKTTKNPKFQRNKKAGKRQKVKKEPTKQQLEDKKYQDIKAKNRIIQKTEVNLSQFKGVNTGEGKVASVLSSVLKSKKAPAQKNDKGRAARSNKTVNNLGKTYKSASEHPASKSRTRTPSDTKTTRKSTAVSKNGNMENSTGRNSKSIETEASYSKTKPFGTQSERTTFKADGRASSKTKVDSRKGDIQRGKQSTNIDGTTSKNLPRKQLIENKEQEKALKNASKKGNQTKGSESSFDKSVTVSKDSKNKNEKVNEKVNVNKNSSEEGEDLFANTKVDTKTKFDSIDEYLDYLSYFFFLEQLYELERDYLTRFDLEWGFQGESGEQMFKITLPFSQTPGGGENGVFNEYSWPDHYVNMRRLPFNKNQVMILSRNLADDKSNFSNNYEKYKDNFWYCSIVDIQPVLFKDLRKKSVRGREDNKYNKRRPKNGKAPKLVKKDVAGFEILLRVFPWCLNLGRSLPVKELYTNFKILPCVEQMNRVFGAMSKIENPDFKRLLMGRDNSVKDVHYKNNLTYFNSNLNESQFDSVQHSINNRVTIIQGPPGTGKTSTIVEIIKQLVLTLRNQPILVVAASNIAIDNIAEKLLEHGAGNDSSSKIKVLRVLATSRESQYLKENKKSTEQAIFGLENLKIDNKTTLLDETSAETKSSRDKVLDACLHNIISSRMSDQDRRMFLKFIRNDVSMGDYNEMSKMLDRRTKISDQIILQSQVILTTNVACGGKSLHVLDKIPYVIMDESTQSNEPFSLIPLSLPGIKRFIFVGDTNQLSSFSNIKEMRSSLFERIINNKMVESPKILNTQYRMNPKISKFPITNVYNNLLLDGVPDNIKKRLSPTTYPLYFIDYSNKSNGGGNSRSIDESKKTSLYNSNDGHKKIKKISFMNECEGYLILDILQELIKTLKCDKEKITIITPYSGQREYLSELIRDNCYKWAENFDTGSGNEIIRNSDKDELYQIEQNTSTSNTINIVDKISISSIDAYQGHENDVIIFSTVRSNPKNNNIGFLNDMRRLNVAITRARKSLIVLGNFKTLQKYGDTIWIKYCEFLKQAGVVFPDFSEYNNDFSNLA
ncbi:hypothetical protein ACO0QE_002803 [Hanseniaspora vineae]